MKKHALPILLVMALLIAALTITATAATNVEPNDVSNYAKDTMSPLFAGTPDYVDTWCPACNANARFYETHATMSSHYDLTASASHWYISQSLTHGGGYKVPAGKKLCIYLNGCDLTSSSVVFATYGTLNIIANGTETIAGSNYGDYSHIGTTFDLGGGTLNLYGGTYQRANTTNVGPVIGYTGKATVNVYNGTTVNGHANTQAGGSIGVYVAESTLNIYGGTVQNGEAPTGGNIGVTAAGCTVNIAGGTVTGGKATSGNGGNIVVTANSLVNINGGTVTGGNAANWGGNFYGEGGARFVMTSGTVQTGNGKYGGNFGINNAYFTLSGGTIKNGTATERAGNLYLSQHVGGSIGGATITGGSLEGGSAVHGGSVFMEGGSKVTMTGLTVTGGTASKLGGAFHVSNAQLTLDNCTVSGGKASTWGGNIYADTSDAKVIVTGATSISGGQAPSGGNITIHDGATLELRSGEISGGVAPNYGGNIFMNDGTLTQTGGTVKNGTSSTDRGGNVYIASGVTANISNAAYEGGSAGYHGGSIFSLGAVTLNNTTVTGGTAAKYGGAIAVSGGSFSMNGGSISGGNASGVGGNLYTWSDATSISFNDVTIENGVAPTGGNGYFTGATTFTDCTLVVDANASGNGSHFYNDGTVTFNNCTVTNGTVMGDGDVVLNSTAANFSNLNMRQKTLTVSGSTTISKATFNEPAGMHVMSNFTGNVNFASMVGAPEAPIYGKLLGDKFTAEGNFTGKIYCTFDVEEPWACNKDGKLMVGASRTVKDGVVTWFADNENAIAGYGDADYLWPVIDGTMALSGNYTVDLGGTNQTITGTGSITLFDSANADFKTYGTATVNGPTVANGFATDVQGNTYYTINNSNIYSFHRLGMKVNGVSLRPSTAGIYYTGVWSCDDALEALIQNFGVAISLDGQPDAGFATDGDSLYTQFAKNEFESGTTKTSVLVNNIFTTEAQDNAQRGKRPIYATAYITFQNGESLYHAVDGEARRYSLHDVLSILDQNIEDYSASNEALESFMNKWSQYGVTGTDWAFDFSVAPEIKQLNALYAGKTAYQGEMHDHADTGGRSDGKQTLETWVKGMKKLKMDFATILDHDQSRHMYLDAWDDAVFIGGTETTGWLTNGIKVTKGEFHMNLIFADVQKFEAFIQEYADKFKPYVDEETGGLIFDASYTYLPETKEYLTELIHAVQKHGGFYVIPHNKQSMQSEDPLDYYFADWTGIEVQYTYYSTRDGAKSQANYKLWTDLLAMGKKLYCTAGNDEHDMPTVKALTTIYAPENTPAALVEQMREGNFNPGPIGIRMAIGDIPMGKEGDFTGKKLAFAVGNIHESELAGDHAYRVDLYCGSQIVQSWDMPATGENFYQVVDIDENADFYRLEVMDEANNSRVALSQPIWNTK